MAGRLELTLGRHPPTGGGGQVIFRKFALYKNQNRDIFKIYA